MAVIHETGEVLISCDECPDAEIVNHKCTCLRTMRMNEEANFDAVVPIWCPLKPYIESKKDK